MTESRDLNRSMLVGTMCEAALAVSVRQFGQPSLEESPFRFLLRETEGPFVGVSGFRRSPQSPAEIRPRRMDQMIVPQIATCEDGVDERKTRQRAVMHRDRDSTIQLDYRRRLRPHQQVVE